uniref:Uncharacterized protein n=1 Tax=Pyxicephalus adspersus TaxID=30357 RepID=A0AAV3A932_PYXAD|nr:TPA: hypothetical protein GDO54_017638 [Pyxicephalus adspersus]
MQNGFHIFVIVMSTNDDQLLFNLFDLSQTSNSHVQNNYINKCKSICKGNLINIFGFNCIRSLKSFGTGHRLIFFISSFMFIVQS